MLGSPFPSLSVVIDESFSSKLCVFLLVVSSCDNTIGEHGMFVGSPKNSSNSHYNFVLTDPQPSRLTGIIYQPPNRFNRQHTFSSTNYYVHCKDHFNPFRWFSARL